MKIVRIFARQIFDSRGVPTVEADVILEGHFIGRAAVPSGASTGSGEALELRDGGQAYGGKGVSQAVYNVNEVIAPELLGKDSADQSGIDELMIKLDGSSNKSNLGANAILAVSLAVAKAQAAASNLPLYRVAGNLIGNSTFNVPIPLMNLINGGKHASGSGDIQEFMIIPKAGQTFVDRMKIGAEVFMALKNELQKRGFNTTVGDEGGFAPAVSGNEQALQLLQTAVEIAGYKLGQDVDFALDVAASELLNGDFYNLNTESRELNSNQMIDWYKSLCARYPIVSIEDGLGEHDWDGWHWLTTQLGGKIQLVGDDLFVTNTALLKKGIEQKAANAILIKPNQIGTLTETINAVKMAHDAGWKTIMSHRSGETEDTTIAHLAVGLGCSQIKTGSLSRSERLAKYNELLRIEETLGK